MFAQQMLIQSLIQNFVVAAREYLQLNDVNAESEKLRYAYI